MRQFKRPRLLNEVQQPTQTIQRREERNEVIDRREQASVPENGRAGDKKVFTVLYTTDIRKKRKKYADAVMVLTMKHATLYDMEGKVIQRCSRSGQKKAFSGLVVGSVLTFYNKEVEIVEEQTIEAFNSGALLMSATPVPDSDTEEPVSRMMSPMILAERPTNFVAHGRSSVAEGRREPKTADRANRGKDDLVLLDAGNASTSLDSFLAKHLREHQVSGVRFLFNSVTGSGRDCKAFAPRGYEPGFEGTSNRNRGCILADEMGLGKTLQSICLLWVLLSKYHVYFESLNILCFSERAIFAQAALG